MKQPCIFIYFSRVLLHVFVVMFNKVMFLVLHFKMLNERSFALF